MLDPGGQACSRPAMLPLPVFWALVVSTCLYALWRGGAPERIGAAIFIIGGLLSAAAISARPVRFLSIESGVLAVDLAMLAAFVVLALRAERFWPIWMTALHIVSTAGHAVKAVDPAMIRLGYAFAMAFWAYPMLLLLVAATWCHRRRLKRNGADISWSSSLNRSGPPPKPAPAD